MEFNLDHLDVPDNVPDNVPDSIEKISSISIK